MAQKQGSSPKIGRAKRPGPSARRKRYRDYVYPVHKLKRVLQGNGYAAAVEYVKHPDRMWTGLLNKLVADPRRPPYQRPPERVAS